jgi:diguanylate cyclase (GGDEF)-like protein
VINAPDTFAELRQWVRDRLQLPEALEQELLEVVDRSLNQRERLWQESKAQAIQSLAARFARRMRRVRQELAVHDAEKHLGLEYCERLVHYLTAKMQHDAKTQLLTLEWFMERLEAYLVLGVCGRWCAVGMVDIASFKSLNDTLGHITGDRILERVADLLRREVRASDLVVHDSQRARVTGEMNARFGGDEFCFCLTELHKSSNALPVAERLASAVADYDWSAEHAALAKGAVNVDVGVICLHRPPPRERQRVTPDIARELLDRAHAQLFIARRNPRLRASFGCVRMRHGAVMEI